MASIPNPSNPLNPFPVNTNQPVTGSSWADQSPFGLNAGLYYPYAPDVMNQNWPQPGGYSSQQPTPQPWTPWPAPSVGGGTLGNPNVPSTPTYFTERGMANRSGLLNAGGGLLGRGDLNATQQALFDQKAGQQDYIDKLARLGPGGAEMLAAQTAFGAQKKDLGNQLHTLETGGMAKDPAIAAQIQALKTQKQGMVSGVDYSIAGPGNSLGLPPGTPYDSGMLLGGGGARGNLSNAMPGWPNVPTNLGLGGVAQPPGSNPLGYGAGPGGNRGFATPGEPWQPRPAGNMPSSAVTPSLQAQYWSMAGLPVYGRIPLGANISPQMVDAIFGYGRKLTKHGGKVAGQGNINRYTASQPGVSEGDRIF